MSKYRINVKKLGNDCKYYRKHIMCMSQEEFGKKFGKLKHDISDFENGKNSNSMYILYCYLCCGFKILDYAKYLELNI